MPDDLPTLAETTPPPADAPVPAVAAAVELAPEPAGPAALPEPANPVDALPAQAQATAEEPAAEPAAAPAVPDLSPAACAARLAELFPALFGRGASKPLKLRIQADIQQRAPGLFTKKSLSIFLHRHTTSTPYLVALSQSPTRFDLDGAAAGELAAEHREAAATELARRRGLHEARRAAENAARREEEAKARQANAAEADARRERAALLRAFETTTLTPANFCALKRIGEAELQAVLAQARLEREQRPPEMPPSAPRQPFERERRHSPQNPAERQARGPRGPNGPGDTARPRDERKGRPRPAPRPASR
jgi:sRNA-binding protein